MLIDPIEYFITIPPLQDGILPIYRINANGVIFNSVNGIILKYQHNHAGYLTVNLNTQTGRVARKVHRLVMMTFKYIPGCENLEVNHIDGNKENNSIYNLEWVTTKENKAHAIRTGLSDGLIGSANPKAVIDEGIVRMIAICIINGVPDHDIADAFCNGNISIVRDIKSGTTWRHLFTDAQFELINSHTRVRNINDEDRHKICKFFQDNVSNYTGYGSRKKMYKDALAYAGYPDSDANMRIAYRMFQRYEDPEITSLYKY